MYTKVLRIYIAGIEKVLDDTRSFPHDFPFVSALALALYLQKQRPFFAILSTCGSIFVGVSTIELVSAIADRCNSHNYYHYNHFLNLAIKLNRIEIIKLLLQDPQTFIDVLEPISTRSLLSETISNLEIFDILLKIPGIDINYDRWDPPILIEAIQRGQIQAVELLLTHKDINPNLEYYDSTTALTIAIQERQIETVKLLLKHPKIDLSTTDTQKLLSFIKISKNGDKEIIKALQNINEVMRKS